jgi:protein tyrosine phosphatase type IVA
MANMEAHKASAGTIQVRNGSHSIGTEMTLIEQQSMRFLIMDAPRSSNVHLYLKAMAKHHVTDVVRVCEPTYSTTDVCSAGITVHEMEYKDGSSPSEQLIQSWLRLVETTFYMTPTPPTHTTTAGGSSTVSTTTVPPCIAVHCIAGLGRAPVMVAIALIEFANMDPIEAVQWIRSRRRGAINNAQIQYLSSYKKQYKKLRSSKASIRTASTPSTKSCCIVM